MIFRDAKSITRSTESLCFGFLNESLKSSKHHTLLTLLTLKQPTSKFGTIHFSFFSTNILPKKDVIKRFFLSVFLKKLLYFLVKKLCYRKNVVFITLIRI
jgi:hypothetical protein